MQFREALRRGTAIVIPDGWGPIRRPVAAVAVLAGLYLLLAALVATGVTAQMDADLWAWFDRFNRPGAEHLMIRFVYRFGQFVLVLVTVVAVSGLVSWRVRSWRPFLVAVGSMGVLDLLMLAFKLPLGRSFPHSGLNTVFGGSGESFQAFPSGHTAHATIGMLLIAVLLDPLLPLAPGRPRWRLRPWAAVLAGLLAFGAGVANVVQGYHWTTDIVGGWIIGVAMFVVAHALLRQGTPSPDAPSSAALADRVSGR